MAFYKQWKHTTEAGDLRLIDVTKLRSMLCDDRVRRQCEQLVSRIQALTRGPDVKVSDVFHHTASNAINKVILWTNGGLPATIQPIQQWEFLAFLAEYLYKCMQRKQAYLEIDVRTAGQQAGTSHADINSAVAMLLSPRRSVFLCMSHLSRAAVVCHRALSIHELRGDLSHRPTHAQVPADFQAHCRLQLPPPRTSWR